MDQADELRSLMNKKIKKKPSAIINFSSIEDELFLKTLESFSGRSVKNEFGLVLIDNTKNAFHEFYLEIYENSIFKSVKKIGIIVNQVTEDSSSEVFYERASSLILKYLNLNSAFIGKFDSRKGFDLLKLIQGVFLKHNDKKQEVSQLIERAKCFLSDNDQGEVRKYGAIASHSII